MIVFQSNSTLKKIGINERFFTVGSPLSPSNPVFSVSLCLPPVSSSFSSSSYQPFHPPPLPYSLLIADTSNPSLSALSSASSSCNSSISYSASKQKQIIRPSTASNPEGPQRKQQKAAQHQHPATNQHSRSWQHRKSSKTATLPGSSLSYVAESASSASASSQPHSHSDSSALP